MMLNEKNGFLRNFWSARHISRANCAKLLTDRPRQAAYEIFSTECRFQRSKSRPSTFKETCAWVHQKAVHHKSRYFTTVGKSTMKTAAEGINMLPVTTSPSNELFSRINIDDVERPWTPNIRGFIVLFCNFQQCRALQKANCDEMAEDRRKQFELL